MIKDEILNIIGLKQATINMLAQKYEVKKLSVFGSYVRGEQRIDSDIDFLVEWNTSPNFDRFMGLHCDLEDATQKSIDLIPPHKLHDYIKARVLSEAQEIYHA